MKNYILAACAFFALFASVSGQNKKEEWPVPPEADAITNPMGGQQPNDGTKKIYQSYCLPCHGEKGVGDGACGISLEPRPYNLTIKKVENETDGSLFWRISKGHLSMPTFGTTLTETQRWQMVNYIRILQRQVDEAKAKKISKNK